MAMPRPDESATYQPWHATAYRPEADLAELFEEFIEDSISFINQRSEANYRRAFGQFVAWLADNDLTVTADALDRRTLTRYIHYLEQRPNLKPGRLGRSGLSRHSIHTYLRPIRTFARYLVADGRLPRDPLWGARSPLPRPGTRIAKPASAADVAFLDAGTQGSDALALRDRVLFLLGLDDGPRTGELCRLLIGHLRLDEAYYEVHEGKGDSSRLVPISREVIAALRRYLRLARPKLTGVSAELVRPDDVLIVGNRGKPMTPNGVYQAIDRAYQRGGGSGPMGLHRLRHLFASHSQEQGADARATQDILGHEDGETTRGYAGVTSLKRKQAVHAAITPIRAYLAKRRRR
jgi:site-specific recombinase XerD